MTSILLYNCRVFTGTKFIENTSLLLENVKIADIGTSACAQEAQTKIDLNGALVVPGFIDTHIHGFDGSTALTTNTQTLLEMSLSLSRFGTTGFFPTLSRLTYHKSELIDTITTIVNTMGKEKGARILGIHLEGPFLSMAKKGAQPPKGIIPIDIELLKEMWIASCGTIKSITIAPELENLQQFSDFCLENQIIMQAGHTDASYVQMQNGFDKGIKHATHFYNGMRGLHHRDPGTVGAILDNDDAYCEIIADGHHVHPVAIRIVQRCKPENKIILITDSLHMTKTNVSSFIENGEEICLNGAFYKKESGTLVGANISMADGVKNLVSFGFPLKSALMAASTNPATLFHLKGYGSIQKGNYADLTILNKDLTVKMTIVNGHIQ